MSNQDETIKHIFSLGRLSRKYEVCKDDNCYFSLQTLFILTITYWVFMVLLGGIVIPGGLFMPSIMARDPHTLNPRLCPLHTSQWFFSAQNYVLPACINGSPMCHENIDSSIRGSSGTARAQHDTICGTTKK